MVSLSLGENGEPNELVGVLCSISELLRLLLDKDSDDPIVRSLLLNHLAVSWLGMCSRVKGGEVRISVAREMRCKLMLYYKELV